MLRLPCGSPFAALLAAVVLLGGCAGSGGSQGATGEFEEMIQGLCSAREAVGHDRADAQRSFDGRAHAALHDLARTLQEDDRRSLAASVLVAKQRVEAGFSEDPPPPDQTERLSELLDRAREGVEAIGIDPPSCLDEERQDP